MTFQPLPSTLRRMQGHLLQVGADFKRFKREVMDVWYAAIGKRGLLQGLSIIRPGRWAHLLTSAQSQ